jgi:hypothetical protein
MNSTRRIVNERLCKSRIIKMTPLGILTAMEMQDSILCEFHIKLYLSEVV